MYDKWCTRTNTMYDVITSNLYYYKFQFIFHVCIVFKHELSGSFNL